MNDMQEEERSPYSFVRGLRDAHFLFCRSDGLFGGLSNVLEECARRLSGLWLVRQGGASVYVC